MKRSKQLQDLSREHHGSLQMAMKMSRVAKNGDSEEIAAAVATVKTYYESELDQHFKHEEQTLFAIISEGYPELKEMADVLLKEHEFMRALVAEITEGSARKTLAVFATILKTHTRTEERELFPLIERLFTQQELEKVQAFKQ